MAQDISRSALVAALLAVTACRPPAEPSVPNEAVAGPESAGEPAPEVVVRLVPVPEGVRAADVLAFVTPAGIVVLRIGCFFGGCCHGQPSRFGVRYPESPTRVLPLPLFEAVVGIGLFATAATRSADAPPGALAVPGIPKTSDLNLRVGDALVLKRPDGC